MIDWESAARAQANLATKSAQQAEDRLHAINLLINNAIEWFASYTSLNGAQHEFGIGVVCRKTNHVVLRPFCRT